MSAETNTPIDIENYNQQNTTKTPQPQTPTIVNKPRNLEMKADGGTVVGLGEGKLTCNIHGFETFDKAELDQHCIDNPEGHTLVGQQKCANIQCQNIIDFPEEEGGIPVADGKNLMCPECFDSQQQLHNNLKQGNKMKLRKVSTTTVENNNGGQQ